MLLDIAAGMIGAMVAWGHGGSSSVSFLFLGVLLALLPDADVFLSIFQSKRGGKYAHEHRNFLHYPLIYLAGGGLFLWFISPRVALLFAALSFFHFLHDSIGIGWGVQWLFPFSQNYFKFFADKENNFSSRVFVWWTPAELAAAVDRYGKDDWLERYYFHLHPVGIIEGIVFLVVAIYAFLVYLR